MVQWKLIVSNAVELQAQSHANVMAYVALSPLKYHDMLHLSLNLLLKSACGLRAGPRV